ncbi:hypothetical protein KUTeg_008471 [Tegillarca granosa]|uniref:Uncharacterized protein n=1 Tax=Tegillarca granosa TaxID=220873 RepID=A0ABQ9F9A4_TEGGR|nr:hypothetical protein KUTeg_008471 [Tegillarca granosa]
MNTKIYCLEQCFLPKNWELLLSAVKNVAGFCKESGKYDIPTLPVKLGHSLSKCAKVLRTKAIMEDNEDVKKSVEGFLKLYEDEWNERISVKARQTLYDAKFN